MSLFLFCVLSRMLERSVKPKELLSDREDDMKK
jgi:hypothetical protein